MVIQDLIPVPRVFIQAICEQFSVSAGFSLGRGGFGRSRSLGGRRRTTGEPLVQVGINRVNAHHAALRRLPDTLIKRQVGHLARIDRETVRL